MSAMSSVRPDHPIRTTADAPAATLRPGAGKRRSALLHPAAKPTLFALCLLPFAWLLYGAWADTLGANPAEALIRSTGDWTLRFLCATLAITPLRQWFEAPRCRLSAPASSSSTSTAPTNITRARCAAWPCRSGSA